MENNEILSLLLEIQRQNKELKEQNERQNKELKEQNERQNKELKEQLLVQDQKLEVLMKDLKDVKEALGIEDTFLNVVDHVCRNHIHTMDHKTKPINILVALTSNLTKGTNLKLDGLFDFSNATIIRKYYDEINEHVFENDEPWHDTLIKLSAKYNHKPSIINLCKGTRSEAHSKNALRPIINSITKLYLTPNLYKDFVESLLNFVKDYDEELEKLLVLFYKANDFWIKNSEKENVG